MKFFIRLFIFCVIPFMAVAQSLELQKMDMEYWTTPDKMVQYTIAVKNISSTTNSYRMRISRSGQTSGHSSTFCFAEQCFGEGQSETSGKDGTVVLPPNEMNDSGHMIFTPNGFMGTTKLTYTIFNDANASDKLDVTITIYVGTTDVKEEATTISSLTPNPASDVTTFIAALPQDVTNANAKVIIIDNVGKQVDSFEFTGNSTQYNTQSLPVGMYTYAITANGKVYSIGKLAVVR